MKKILFLYLLFSISSCEGGSKETLGTDIIDVVLPDDFLRANPQASEYFSFPRNRVLVLKYVNTGCSICKLEMEEWKNLLLEYSYIDYADFVFIAHGSTRADVDFLFFDTKLEEPHFYDSTYSFMDLNQISADRGEQALVISKSGEIILRTSPLTGSKSLKKFVKTIKTENEKY